MSSLKVAFVPRLVIRNDFSSLESDMCEGRFN